ncbi:MAG TPA: hypothetical protein VI685_06570 [Candidatus Angelobacter sp.]
MNSIRLITCVTLSLEEELAVQAGQPPQRLEGHTSHDQMVGPVKDLLQERDLPWSEIFVSLFVLLPGDDTSALHDAFGYPFELNVERVMPYVAMVCSDDVQNWVDKAAAPTVYADLRDKPKEVKITLLRKALVESDERRAEARMNRALQLDDLLPLENR